jgi:sugar phosphate isomerase/epimerase
MKIAISNIAWQIEEEPAIANLLQQLNIKGVEIAPTKIWQNPLTATDAEIKKYREFWQGYGIEIVAMQALLFGRNDLTIFESKEKRQATLSYLYKIIELGNKLGVNVLVFGSPKNRTIGDLPEAEVQKIAQDFFYALGEIAVENQVSFCIEPNPPAYNCDFIINSQQGLELVKQTNSQGFRLHLDAAGMTLGEEDLVTSLSKALPYLCHFHISEPFLGQVGDGKVDHETLGKTLKALNYQGWTSIEMRSQSEESNLDSVRKALLIAQQWYLKPAF